jgi:hypothetical protein
VADFPQERGNGAVAAVNEVIDAMATQGQLVHHLHKSSQLITTPNAADLGTSKTLARALALAVIAHTGDTDIHTADDGTAQAAAWASAPAEPANLTEVQNILNELKTDLNAHVASTAAHRNKWGAPGTTGLVAFAITTADANDQSTANALANAIKGFLNLHMQSAASSVEVVAS